MTQTINAPIAFNEEWMPYGYNAALSLLLLTHEVEQQQDLRGISLFAYLPSTAAAAELKTMLFKERYPLRNYAQIIFHLQRMVNHDSRKLSLSLSLAMLILLTPAFRDIHRFNKKQLEWMFYHADVLRDYTTTMVIASDSLITTKRSKVEDIIMQYTGVKITNLLLYYI